MNPKRVLAGLATILLTTAGIAYGQDAQQGDQAAPGVGHVSYIRGQVSTQRGDSGEWTAATLNTPVMPGDRVSTAGGSRAEVQLDYANLIRMDQNSTANIVNLTRDQIQLQVGQGLVNYDVLRGSGANAEIDTPNMAVHPVREGSYRIEVLSDSETRVVVRSGEAQISTPQGSTNVKAGQAITVEGTDNPQYQTASAPGDDDWDHWNRERDSKITHAESWRHTDPYYTGSGDLDAYGHWRNVPDYGSVWVPDQDPGWAPYRDGRWVWEPYYGWTWVSYEPWGWAPYHYGRWMLYDDDWSWWPGPVVGYPAYYPVWAPAYVSFFGFGGGGWNFGFGFGNVGWLPIGPGDFFCPWWGGFGSTFISINFFDFDRFGDRDDFFGDRDDRFREGGLRPVSPLFHSGNIRGASNLGVLENTRLRAGISSMNANEFGKAAVPTHQRGIDPAVLRQGQAFAGRVPVVPTRQSMQSTNHAPAPGTIRAGVGGNQRFFGKAQASFTPRPFSEQAQATQRIIQSGRSQALTNRGQPSDFTRGGVAREGQGIQPNRDFTSRGSTPAQPATRPGFQSFGQRPMSRTPQDVQPQSQPNRGFTQRPQSPAQPATRPGFQSFGQGGVSRPNGNAGGPGWSQPSRTPPSQMRNAPGSGLGQPAPNRGGGGWQTFRQPSRQNYGGNSPSYDRQPLNLHQPVVTQRNNSPYSGGSRGGYYGGSRSPSYNAPPSYGGRAPSYGGSPNDGYGGGRGGYSGGGSSPPRGGGGYAMPRGGYSGGGGGGYSPPRGGGGYSAPRDGGGGGRSGDSSRGGGGGGRPHH